ncbi:MAG: SpoIID/LytB domain-containing protein [Bacteroidales bacterium]|nr:SpoIID/LytB domain-containing protein [Bacteroidales bacterium]
MLLYGFRLSGHPVWVGVFNNAQVQSVVMSAYNGALNASGDDSLFVIAGNQAVYVVLHGDKIVVGNANHLIGVFDKLTVTKRDSSAAVRLRPVLPLIKARNYEDSVCLYADIGRIRMINRIDEAHYLAGVIEAETGLGRTHEFYKATAVIARTYLYGHYDRHYSENFHLCDETHCQAYKGKCNDALIQLAVSSTADTIITWENKPISATYHANCGGQTESAKNAWQSHLPYLVSVSDPYCTSYPSAQWKKNIVIDDWIAYLMKNGFKPNPNIVSDFSFQQTARHLDYKVNDVLLPFKQIRTDWDLRSAFFSVAVEDGNVLLNGRGYGHGVGLCQEGAMEMSRRGYNYGDIIRFYYQGVSLTKVTHEQ